MFTLDNASSKRQERKRMGGRREGRKEGSCNRNRDKMKSGGKSHANMWIKSDAPFSPH